MNQTIYLEFYAEDEMEAIATRNALRLLHLLNVGIVEVHAHQNWAGDITITIHYKT